MPFDAVHVAEQHLLLSEVKLRVTGQEFIELYNPTDDTIELANYYLSDTKEYAKLPGEFGVGPAPGIDTRSDFIVRFPVQARIAGHEVVVIALRPTSFSAVFGIDPNYRIGDGNVGRAMEPAYSASIGSEVTLTDDGEGIALFYWNGDDDLVTDVDLLNSGKKPKTKNRLLNKTNLEVDGPDSGDTPSMYQDDVKMPLIGDTEEQQSYTRVLLELEHETHDAVGNGLFGHDETSEAIETTWQVLDATPGTVPASLSN